MQHFARRLACHRIREKCPRLSSITVKDTLKPRIVNNCKQDQVQYHGTLFNDTFKYPFWKTSALRGQRAKAMKFGDGYMIKTGHAGQVYTDTAVRHVLMRQGVIGIRVAIMLPQDPKGLVGPKIPLDDVVTIIEPKEEPKLETLLQQQEEAEAARLAAQAAAAAAPVAYV